MIVDAHLDLAYNALRGRDVLKTALEQQPDGQGIPIVGLPDLRAGRVGLICGTLFVAPATVDPDGYGIPAEAHEQALAQLRWYQRQETARQLRLVRRAVHLPTDADPGTTLHCIILMEGADPIQSPEQVTWWHGQGVRIVGLAWQQTRYAGGTGAPGGLTPQGREVVRQLNAVGMIHDVSHLAEQAFWQLLEMTDRPVIASHSNCRSLIPTDRQLSDEMIRAIIARGGVIGINFYDRFLIPAYVRESRRATLADVMDHIKHICDIAGSADHVAIGTDFDGGLGREQIPHEITTAADLSRVEQAAAVAGFSPRDIRKIMSANWLNFFRRHLP